MAAGVAGNKQRGRGRGRVNPQGRGMMNPPGQGPAQPGNGGGPQAPGRGRGRGQGQGAGQGQQAGVGGGGMVGPGGRQLSARVSSGKITQEQAQRTMKQRQTLAKALGPDWRDKLQVGGKSFAQVNAGLKKNPGSPKLAALRKKLTANRTTLLQNARSKGKGGHEETEGED